MKVRPKQQQLLREAYKLWPTLVTGYICVAIGRAAEKDGMASNAGYCKEMVETVQGEIEGFDDVLRYLGVHPRGSGGFEAVCKLPEVMAKRMEIWRLLFTKYEIPLEELK